MKIVGKRQTPKSWEAFDKLQELVMELRQGKPLFPRGVYRFKTHKEAEEWSQKMRQRLQESHR